jgi:hypothetical protein
MPPFYTRALIRRDATFGLLSGGPEIKSDFRSVFDPAKQKHPEFTFIMTNNVSFVKYYFYIGKLFLMIGRKTVINHMKRSGTISV